MVLTALQINISRGLFAAVVLAGIFSLFSVALFVSLNAVDVALTEAVVGIGISVVLFVSCLALTGSDTPADPAVHAPRRKLWPALPVCALCAALLCYGSWDLPGFGDPSSPVNSYLSPYYLEGSGSELQVPNVVTSVLASYRGYDTLGELVVIYTAGVGVLALIGRGRRRAAAVKPQ